MDGRKQDMRGWRNWQTRTFEVRVVYPWGFESPPSHHRPVHIVCWFFFCNAGERWTGSGRRASVFAAAEPPRLAQRPRTWYTVPMHNGVRKAVNCLKEEQEDRRGSLDQTVFPDTAALKECLKGVNRNEDGYYTVSTLWQRWPMSCENCRKKRLVRKRPRNAGNGENKKSAMIKTYHRTFCLCG